jgi:hypothetical protein
MKNLALLLIFACCNAFAQTGHPYDPITDGTSLTYNIYAIIGTYNDTDMRISVDTSVYHGTNKISFSANKYDSYSTKDLYVRYYHATATPPTPINFAATLQEAKWTTWNNFSFIGEMVNELGNTMIPPLPKLQRNPVGGFTYSSSSVVRKSVTDDTIINPAFAWKYRTIEHMAAPWNNYIDCWRTGLREYNVTKKDRVYNYLFMRDKGMVNFWYGDLNADGTVTGYQFQAVIN